MYSSSVKVLIIEDTPAQFELMKNKIEEYGFSVFPNKQNDLNIPENNRDNDKFYNNIKRIITDTDIEIILLDLVLREGIDTEEKNLGLELLREIRDRMEIPYKAIPIIVITKLNAVEAQVYKGLGNYFLQKGLPFKPMELFDERNIRDIIYALRFFYRILKDQSDVRIIKDMLEKVLDNTEYLKITLECQFDFLKKQNSDILNKLDQVNMQHQLTEEYIQELKLIIENNIPQLKNVNIFNSIRDKIESRIGDEGIKGVVDIVKDTLIQEAEKHGVATENALFASLVLTYKGYGLIRKFIRGDL